MTMNIEKENEYRIERNTESLDMNTMEQVAGGGFGDMVDTVTGALSKTWDWAQKNPAAAAGIAGSAAAWKGDALYGCGLSSGKRKRPPAEHGSGAERAGRLRGGAGGRPCHHRCAGAYRRAGRWL